MDIRLEDVAKRVGMSKSTVSLALNGSDKVNLNTRNLILQVAAEMGYSPNPHARKLAMRKSNMIGLIVPDFENVYYASWSAHLPRATQNGVRPVHLHQREFPQARKAHRAGDDRKPDGRRPAGSLNKPNEDVKLPVTAEAAEIPMVYSLQYPAVQRPTDCDLYSVCHVVRSSTAGLPENRDDDRAVRRVLHGPARDGLPRTSCSLGLTYEKHGRRRLTTQARLANRALRSPELDAIVCENDMMALGVINASTQSAERPGDIVVAGYDVLIIRDLLLTITPLEAGLEAARTSPADVILA
jgi:DNA-binding LacI/PurR family transcriptional regulator